MAGAVERRFLQEARRGLRALIAPASARAPGLQSVTEITVRGGAGPTPGRLYFDAEAEDAPLLVYLHGGGFVCCDIDTHDALCSWLAKGLRGRVLSVGYRLAPETPFPGQLEDAYAASLWALEEAAQFGTRGGIMLGGDSAGAYLAAMTALRLNEESPRRALLQILLYPLVHLRDSLWAEQELHDFRFLGRVASLYIARAIGAETFPSLLDRDLSAAPGAIIAAGAVLDPVRRDAQALAQALRDAKVEVEERTYPLLAHGALSFAGVSKTATNALLEVGALARAALARI